MLLDLISTDANCTYNVKLASLIGIENAVYCSALLHIMSKAKIKNKLDTNGFMLVDRNYIKKQTSMSLTDQRKCDERLISKGLLYQRWDNKEALKLDIEQLTSIILEEDKSKLKQLQALLKPVNKQRDDTKENYLNVLYNSIKTQNLELNKLYRSWINLKSSSQLLGSQQVEEFENGLHTFALNNVDLECELVKIAINGNFLYYSGVITHYLSQNPTYNSQNSYAKANVEDLGNEEF